MSTSHHATALPVKGINPKPKGQCSGDPPLLWGFISLHFGFVGFRFLAFWPLFPFILAVCAFISLLLALWAFISLQFGIVGLHFLAFWAFISFHFGLVGLHFLAFWWSASGPPPTSCQKWPVCPMSLQWIAFWAFISLHFGLVGLHFLPFWLCGPSFPCILALWAFISLHFGGQLLGPPHKLPKIARLPNVLTMDLSAS